MHKLRNVKLVLEDGTIFEGKSFGKEKSIAGEVVFYTAMVGYTESLSDPSYKGQILVPTYPMVGNYGIPSADQQEGVEKFYESDRIHASGLVVADYTDDYSHWNAEKSLGDWLKENDVPGITGIDTRQLTKILREKGSMKGKIEFEDQPIDFCDPNDENLAALVSTDEVITYGNGNHKVVLVDCGVKYNIIRCLLKRDTTVIRVPWDYDFTQIDCDGIFLSNGPGDPIKCEATVSHIRKALDGDTPIMGICLGNQLLGRAAGCETYKLKYGHRSHNQPVLLNGTQRCFITSQNHGYAINQDTLPEEWEELFINVNDGTNEGIRHKSKPFFSTQFHPEASSGPVDTEYLFDEFIESIEKSKAKQ
ncbi:glutamine-hydrolyzing carbamoyl-phosphate synthase small subunit [Halosquirtibacter xylanolyticus]|uniref:glutamine-hydrolyzing carbamoyl-phosphate synthase small subunit n=1 Tax=Halosquirtibacter xylanolyticus TaxID=3374599 RepID=UPI003749EEA6|nr:glutamine-hydrolyzing carbamoyl-phosphate synthase small subunit [Prolixibacteraceae bacterium]